MDDYKSGMHRLIEEPSFTIYLMLYELQKHCKMKCEGNYE